MSETDPIIELLSAAARARSHPDRPLLAPKLLRPGTPQERHAQQESLLILQSGPEQGMSTGEVETVIQLRRGPALTRPFILRRLKRLESKALLTREGPHYWPFWRLTPEGEEAARQYGESPICQCWICQKS